MPNLSNAAAQALQRRIAEGEYKPGQTLPPQRELSGHLGISRASLREAISMLEALGLVRAQPGKGVFVTAGTTRTAGDLPAGPSAMRPEAIFQFRYVMEPAAAALAARNPSADAGRLEEVQDKMESALRGLDLVMAAEWDLEFHRRVAELSGNETIVAVLRQNELQIAYSLRLPFANPKSIWEPADEHRQVIRAIADRDAAAARRAMQAHLLRAATRVGIHFDQP